MTVLVLSPRYSEDSIALSAPRQELAGRLNGFTRGMFLNCLLRKTHASTPSRCLQLTPRANSISI